MSSSIEDGQPFGLKYNTVKGNAGDMTHGKARTEVEDNSWNKGATYSNSKHLVLDEHDAKGNVKKNDKGETIRHGYSVIWNDGRRALDMAHLYGLATKTPANSDDGNGMFHHGFLAFVGYNRPETIYSESGDAEGLNGLEFRVLNFERDLEAHADDVRKVSPGAHMKPSDERLSAPTTLLKRIVAATKDPVLKGQLSDIQEGRAPQYMMHILKYPVGHMTPDCEQRSVIRNERLYYCDKLKSGASISFEDSEGVLNVASADTAIDPLDDRTKFPVLESANDVRVERSGKLIAKLTLKNAGSPDSRTLYLAYSGDKRCKYPQFTEAEPAEWATSTPHIKLTSEQNALDDDAAKQQVAKLNPEGNKVKDGEEITSGSDFKGVTDLRGVFLKWCDRTMGRPYWRKGAPGVRGFGDIRNPGHVRFLLKAEGDKKKVVDTLNIHANKHTTDLDKCDPLLHQLVFGLLGTMIHKYTGSEGGNSMTKGGKKTLWNLDDFQDHMLDRPLRSVTAAAAARLAASARAAPRVSKAAAATAVPASTVPAAANVLTHAPIKSPSPAPAPAAVETRLVAPGIAPTTEVSPLPSARPAHDLIFGEIPHHLTIIRKGAVLARIRFAGRHGDIKRYYEGVLEKVGVDRFLEWAQAQVALNHLLE